MVVIQIVTPLSKLDYGRGYPSPLSPLPSPWGWWGGEVLDSVRHYR